GEDVLGDAPGLGVFTVARYRRTLARSSWTISSCRTRSCAGPVVAAFAGGGLDREPPGTRVYTAPLGVVTTTPSPLPQAVRGGSAGIPMTCPLMLAKAKTGPLPQVSHGGHVGTARLVDRFCPKFVERF